MNADPNRRAIKMHGTTVLAVRFGGKMVMAGDGQVTMGDTVMKAGAKKIRRLAGGKTLAGFAGATADAMTLLSLFEKKMEAHSHNLERAVDSLSREWRTDKMLRRLEAMLLVADGERQFILTGEGDALEPEHGAAAIGSGAPFALAAARALMMNGDSKTDSKTESSLTAADIARRAMAITAEICIYTNDRLCLEEL